MQKKAEVTLWAGCKGKGGRVEKEASRSRYKGAFSSGETNWLLAGKETRIERDENEKEDSRARISIKGLTFVLLWIFRDTGLQITKEELALSLGIQKHQ